MNDRRRKPAHPGDRTLIPCPRTEHRAGWVEASMNRVLPDDATADFRAGYDEARRGAEFEEELV
jgi:hypothetical protein